MQPDDDYPGHFLSDHHGIESCLKISPFDPITSESDVDVVLSGLSPKAIGKPSKTKSNKQFLIFHASLLMMSFDAFNNSGNIRPLRISLPEHRLKFSGLNIKIFERILTTERLWDPVETFFGILYRTLEMCEHIAHDLCCFGM